MNDLEESGASIQRVSRVVLWLTLVIYEAESIVAVDRETDPVNSVH
jgi:hypothetical protein